MRFSREPGADERRGEVKMHRRARNAVIVALGLLIGCASKPAADKPTEEPAAKIKVTKADELPQHNYPFDGKVSELVRSDEQIAELAKKVRANIEADLAKYEISDPKTLQGMYGTLLTIDFIEGKLDSVAARIEQIRELEAKEAKKATTGLSALAMIDARKEVGKDAPQDKYAEAYGKHLGERASKLEWSVVQEAIQQAKGQAEIRSENLMMGIVQAQIEPTVAKTKMLNADQAASVLGIHFMLEERLPLRDATVAVYQKLIDKNKVVKPDIWAERSVVLDKKEKHTPVLAAVWDSGVDANVFKGRMFTNKKEKKNGKDDDDNGFVDDIHGTAYDYHAKKTTGELYPLGDAEKRMPQVMKHLKGITDIQAAIDSPEASALKMHLGSIEPAKVKGFMEDMSLAGNYAHGTHVAGIMAEGNPFIRLLNARHTYDYHIPPVVRTVEWGERDGAKCHDTVEYFKQQGVRVVNMSWGEAQKDAEDSLEANGVGKDAEERREIARKVFASQRKGLYEAMKNAPDILFVAAAGNSDSDVQFDEYIPSGLELPNLITVGAVDQAGDPTSFTSTGKTVQVYANGFEVESYVPGGNKMKMSGTSMASPNVANLAAKILAVKPSLEPAEVIALIKEGAEKKRAGKHTLLLIHPKHTLELVKK